MDLTEIIKTLRIADRIGAEKDVPEGTRYIQLSDTLANEIADDLERIQWTGKK